MRKIKHVIEYEEIIFMIQRNYKLFIFLNTNLCAKSLGGRAALMISRTFERYGWISALTATTSRPRAWKAAVLSFSFFRQPSRQPIVSDRYWSAQWVNQLNTHARLCILQNASMLHSPEATTIHYLYSLWNKCTAVCNITKKGILDYNQSLTSLTCKDMWLEGSQAWKQVEDGHLD